MWPADTTGSRSARGARAVRHPVWHARALVRAGRPRPLLAASALIAGGAIVAAVVEVVYMLAPPPAPWVALLFPGVALVYVATGLGAWLRRPSSGLGGLLVFGGGCLFLGGFANMGSQWLAAIAAVTATVILALVILRLLASPPGRLHDRTTRVVVVAGYLVSLVLQAPLYLFAPAGKLSIADRHD